MPENTEAPHCLVELEGRTLVVRNLVNGTSIHPAVHPTRANNGGVLFRVPGAGVGRAKLRWRTVTPLVTTS